MKSWHLNRKEAWKHFWPEGNGKPKPGYALHHIDPSWKKDDPERYAEWRIEDLVMMTRSEHTRLHTKGKSSWLKGGHLSEAQCKEISERMKGKNNPQFRKHPSEETIRKRSESLKGHKAWNKGKRTPDEVRKKQSEAMKGRKTWNTGLKMPPRSKEWIQHCADAHRGKKRSEESIKKMAETKLGTFWWTNGTQTKLCKECPGEGWVRGRLKPNQSLM